MDYKRDPTICCLQQTHFKFKDTNRLNVKRKRIRVAVLTSDKIDSKTEIILILGGPQVFIASG
jgi:hypothetical protein